MQFVHLMFGRRPMPDGVAWRTPADSALPHNLEAESAYLGCALHGARPEIVDTLTSDDFVDQEHRAVFAAIKAVRAAGATPDVATVAQFMGPAWAAYLQALADCAFLTANEPHYAAAVRDNGRRRREIALADQIASAARAGRDTAGLRRELAAAPSEAAGRFEAIAFADIKAERAPLDLVAGVLGENTLAVLYGESGRGKTFVALDLALRIASGRDWQGRATKPGLVAYVALEGGHGIKARAAAWRERYGEHGAPFVLIPGAADLCSSDADAAGLAATINAEAKRYGCPVRLAGVDTVSRAMAGGNENDSQDMGRLVRNLDVIREATGGTVLETTQNDDATIVLKVVKQRDGEDGGCFGFELEAVDVDNGAGGTIGTAVIVPGHVPATGAKFKPSSRDKLAIDALSRLIVDEGEALPQGRNYPPAGHYLGAKMSRFREEFYSAVMSGTDRDTSKKAFQRTRERLQAAGLIAISGDWVWLPGQAGQCGTF